MKTYGQIGFEAYGGEPEWEGLSEKVKERWARAADAIVLQAIQNHIQDIAGMYEKGSVDLRYILLLFSINPDDLKPNKPIEAP